MAGDVIDWGSIALGAGTLLTAATTAYFAVTARREAKRVAVVTAEKAVKLDMVDAAQASLKQSLDWSDADRKQLRTSLALVQRQLNEVQTAANVEQIKCANKIAELNRRIEELEARP